MPYSNFLENQLESYSSHSEFDVARTGEISPDRSSILGDDGWCFIYEGGNNYYNSYLDKSLYGIGEMWANLIEDRSRKLKLLSIPFLQLIVPNKATLMPDRYPLNLDHGITIPLRALIEANSCKNFLSPVDEMRNSHVVDCLFRRNDSHLTLAGNSYLVDLILQYFEITLGDVEKIKLSIVTHLGDLGSKFENQILENFYAPSFDDGLLDAKNYVKIIDIAKGGYIGTRQSFFNPNAQIKKSILVFGNSFFEKNPSWGISPLMASIFQNYHFIWSPDIDIALVEEINPDFVIAQTCERFLIQLPAN